MVWVCPVCGYENDTENGFCIECGFDRNVSDDVVEKTDKIIEQAENVLRDRLRIAVSLAEEDDMDVQGMNVSKFANSIFDNLVNNAGLRPLFAEIIANTLESFQAKE